MLGPCQNSNCTFNSTKKCVLGNPPEVCPSRSADGTSDEDGVSYEVSKDSAADQFGESQHSVAELSATGAPVLIAPDDDLARFPQSRTLGLDDVNAMMGGRSTCLIGIVGLAGAGKTAALVSAYLMLARGQFNGFSYADSNSLRAFEEISRASRTWDKTNPPEQITSHTTLSNDREAGFLHLKLRRKLDGAIVDFLLPDLPGEWSSALIDRSDGRRFGFLRAANVIWLMVDGRQFSDDGKVANAHYRATLLIERLADLLEECRPRLIIVPTWQDRQEFPKEQVEKLTAFCAEFGFAVSFAPIASFSWNDNIEPGHGVADLFADSLSPSREANQFWPETSREKAGRQIAAFREWP